MIIKNDTSKVIKRWVYRLDGLNLEKTKVDGEDGDEELVPTLQPPKLIVSEETEDSKRTYTQFSGYPELYRYIKNHRKEFGVPPSLYEVCPYYMKMHFDIDLPTTDLDMEVVRNKEEVILLPILIAFRDTLEKHLPGKFTDKLFVDTLVITQSHTVEKISYHVVQDTFFMTNIECKMLYRDTKALLEKRSQKLQADSIDHSVYGNNQNFRVYGCCKRNKRNSKEVYTGPALQIGSESYTHQRLTDRLSIPGCLAPLNMKILAASLISNIITSMRLALPVFEKLQPERVLLMKSKAKGKPVEKLEMEAFKIFSSHPLSKSQDGSPAFELSYALTGGIVVINRIKPSHCSLCERVHDEENNYLKIEMNNDVHYYCRRAQDNSPKKGKKSAAKMDHEYVGTVTCEE